MSEHYTVLAMFKHRIRREIESIKQDWMYLTTGDDRLEDVQECEEIIEKIEAAMGAQSTKEALESIAPPSVAQDEPTNFRSMTDLRIMGDDPATMVIAFEIDHWEAANSYGHHPARRVKLIFWDESNEDFVNVECEDPVYSVHFHIYAGVDYKQRKALIRHIWKILSGTVPNDMKPEDC